MGIYLLLFALSSLSFYFATKAKHIFFRYLWLLIAVLFPSVLAGVRDETIGTDMYTYVIFTWEKATEYENLFEFVALMQQEFGYCALNLFVSRYTHELCWFLFIHQFVVMTFVVLTAWKLRKKFNSVFILALYFLCMYNNSLTAMRQVIAIVIVMYAYTFLLNEFRNTKIYYVLLAIAFLFHNSVMFFVTLPFLNALIERFNDKRLVLYFCTLGGLLILFWGFQTILGFMLDSGIASSKYNRYLGQEEYNTHKIPLLVECLMFCFNFVFFREFSDGKRYFYLQYILILIIGFEMMGSIVETAARVVYYFFVLIPIVVSNFVEYTNKKIVTYVAYFAIFLLYYVLRASSGFQDTVPYTSRILGITGL